MEAGKMISAAWEIVNGIQLAGDADCILHEIRKNLRECDMDLWGLIEDFDELTREER
jgi:hypothetical protein